MRQPYSRRFRHVLLSILSFLLPLLVHGQARELESTRSLYVVPAGLGDEDESEDDDASADSSTASASECRLSKTALNVGLGIESVLGGAFPNQHTVLPPMSASLDFPISKRISIGGYVGAAKIAFTADYYGEDVSGSATYFLIGIRGLYHFKLIRKCDTYTGVLLSYNVGSADVPVDYLDFRVSGMVYGFTLGAKYEFSKSIGGFAELGYGVSIFNLGASIALAH